MEERDGLQVLPLEVEHEEQRTADRLGGTAMLVLLVCCSLVLFSVPAMSYNLFKPSLASNLDLSPSESQAIVSSALVGGMVFGFVPGIIYDRFGYVTTLCYGGIFSCCGALLWFVTLQDGGARDDPSSLTLSLAFAVLSHGCRCMYLAGTCAALRALPPQYTGSVAALLAISVSLGYILLPLAWRNVFMPAPDDENFDPTTQLLANLKPVAHFFLFLAVIYAIATVLGLCLAPLLPPLKAAGRSPGASRRQKLKEPPAVSMFCFVALSMAFTYTYLTGGLAAASKKAHPPATPQERATVILWNGICGMASRFAHGFGADLLRGKFGFGEAGLYLSLCSSITFSIMGFLVLMYSESWKIATYLIGFSFGGMFSLFAPAICMIFGKQEMGFWMGILFVILGVMHSVYGQLAVRIDTFTYYLIGCLAAAVSLSFFLVLAWSKSERP